MSDLINQIRAAQVRAAEDAVLESLRGTGLIDDAAYEAEQLQRLKRNALDLIHAAEKAAYEYFKACPVGVERTRAHDVFENIRNATRV
ncbi:hypothetical protein [Paraburkholderia sp. RL18-085-BIA-A]|uniref:hypothetical protein n=1 Tax=Paraburkholderia sp. RL18-085-BIA-A TaxID=3031633 RepID=UPI0038BD3ACC